MYGARPVDERFFADFRLCGLKGFGQGGLGLDEVDGGQEAVGIEDVLHIGAQLLREIGQYADDFAALVGLQFADAIVGLHHLGRLYEDRLSGGTLIVDDTAYLALQGRGHGYHQAPVAHGGSDVFLHQPFTLGRMQDAVQRARDAALGLGQLAADVAQFG